MRNQKRCLAVSFLSCACVCLVLPSAVEAGPLLDWLFHRNRSQSLATSTAGYPGVQSGNSLMPSCCLFGNRRTSNYPPQAAATTAATTAGYAPQGSCGPGWCQQTVVQYVPQIAYRTAYQPVPVTTYKTSTTINPANGLPRTCTRPCTTYSYQARRVPYTTYRPVYTTVPVNDDLGQQAYAQRTAGFGTAASPPLNSNYALQPTSPGVGCSSCQNGSTMGLPGYTPGNAINLPPNPQSGPWSNGAQSGFGSGTNGPGATDWQPVDPGFRSSTPGAGSSYGTNGGPAGATPWQSMPNDGYTTPPSGTEADERPRLRPEYPERYSDDTSNRLRPVPMSDEDWQRLNKRNGSSFDATNRIDGREDQTRYQNRRPETYPLERQDSPRDNYAGSEEYPFSTPRPTRSNAFGRSESQPVEEQNPFDFNERSTRRFRARAVRDLDREQPSMETSWPQPGTGDDTAMRTSSSLARGQRPLLENHVDTTDRFATVPIDWNAQRQSDRSVSQPSRRSLWKVR